MTLLFPEIEPTNKFHVGNGSDGKHYWLTPPDLYAALDTEFHFDFDPCPWPLPDGFDGLTCRKKGPTAWVRKALFEYRKGKTVVLVYRRNLGDVRWRATEDGSEGPGTGRHIACFVLESRP